MNDPLKTIQIGLNSRTAATTWSDYKNSILDIIYSLQELGELPSESVYMYGTLRPVDVAGTGDTFYVVSYTMHAEHALDIAEKLMDLEIKEFSLPHRKETIFGDRTMVEGRSSLSVYVPSIQHTESIPSVFLDQYKILASELLTASTMADFIDIWNANELFWSQLYCRSKLKINSKIPSLKLKTNAFTIDYNTNIHCDVSHFTAQQLCVLPDSGIFTAIVTTDTYPHIKTLRLSPSFLKHSNMQKQLNNQIAIWESVVNPNLGSTARSLELRVFLENWLKRKSTELYPELDVPGL